MTKNETKISQKSKKSNRDSNSESSAKPTLGRKAIRKDTSANPRDTAPQPNEKTANKVGRPPESVPADTAAEIIDWISHGNTLREFCRQEGRPSWRTVYLWIEKDPEFAARFARARDIGADAIAEEALEIIDTPPEMAFSQSGAHKDSAHVSWLKNRAEMRLKLLAKWNPKKYGDKLDMNHGVQPENPLTSLIQRIAGTGLPVVKDVPDDDGE